MSDNIVVKNKLLMIDEVISLLIDEVNARLLIRDMKRCFFTMNSKLDNSILDRLLHHIIVVYIQSDVYRSSIYKINNKCKLIHRAFQHTFHSLLIRYFIFQSYLDSAHPPTHGICYPFNIIVDCMYDIPPSLFKDYYTPVYILQ